MSKKLQKFDARKIVFLVAVFLLALAGGMSGSILSDRLDVFNLGSTPLTETKDGNSVELTSEKNIARVVKEVSPSVVSIVANVNEDNASSRFGAGTGIIVSKNGYVMTNKHVVSGATDVTVTTTSGDVYEGVEVVGEDPLNDVAFLKIAKVNNLKPAEIGNSGTLRIGQSVITIGNSLGQYHDTVTSGIVSGLGRPVMAQGGGGATESLNDLIQTDAAINPGNSGGPLVNLSGQVVGINTAVADANGIGFAIPIDATKGILQSVLETGEVKKAYIGVRYIDITPAIANSRDLPVKKGALVSSGSDSDGEAVVEDSPADKAGIKDGDIIIKINDTTVGESGNVSSLVSQFVPGTEIEVTYIRDTKERTANLTLGEYEEPREVSTPAQRMNNENETPDIYRYLPFGF